MGRVALKSEFVHLAWAKATGNRRGSYGSRQVFDQIWLRRGRLFLSIFGRAGSERVRRLHLIKPVRVRAGFERAGVALIFHDAGGRGDHFGLFTGRPLHIDVRITCV